MKKKKKKSKLVVLVLVLGIVAAGCSGGYMYTQNKQANEDTEEIVLEQGQTLVYAKIDAISGNEMTYTEVEAQEMTMGQEYEGITTDDDGNRIGYVATEVTNTRIIPVGTDVYTILGNTTTFSRLANGDLIKMIVQTDAAGDEVIMKVWIIG